MSASFGTPSKAVMASQRRYQTQCERWPDKWLRGGYLDYTERSLDAVSASLGGERADLVFVDNVTAGIGACFRSFAKDLKPGDVVTHLSTAYVYLNPKP